MTVTAARLGLVCCRACALLSRTDGQGTDSVCPRCGARLRGRKRNSLGRTTALLIAAALLFIPANLLPVMTTSTPVRSHSDTILSGVVTLWMAGSWPLSIVVFAASIVLPGLKILALTLLVVSTRLRWAWRRGERTRLYRLVERAGRWSMLDIFVMALLAALLRSRVASVEINAGAVAFASVVVLTMLSSMTFDPRLIWDRKGECRE